MTKMTLKRLASCILCMAVLIHDASSFTPASPLLTSFSSIHHKNDYHVTNPSTTTTTTTQLNALPSWTYPVAHILGGATGTPIVISGTKAGSWYDRIPKPSFNPPNFIFGPVWTALYGLMGLSLSRIIKASSSSSNTVVKLWYVHYALNLSWAPIFFGLQKFRLGLLISLLLVLTLGAIILPLYHAIDPLAAYLQVPYLGWLLFATLLNYNFCVLNPVDESGMNEAMRQARLLAVKRKLGEYTEERLKSDIEKLQLAAREYAGL